MENVFTAAFKSDDELFHVEMYQWLLSEKQYDRLLSVRSPYLEDFLTRGIYNKLILTKAVCETMKNTPINITARSTLGLTCGSTRHFDIS